MIIERPHITIQELSPAQWAFADITDDQWITGTHEELQQRILVLRDHVHEQEEINQQLRADNRYKDDIIGEYRERDSRARRLRSNKEISPAHKLVLTHIEDKVSQIRPDPTDPIRIDMTAVGEAVGLSRYTVGDKIRDLANWGAIEKTVEKVPLEKKGKKIEVDHVSAALNDIFFKAPEDIKPIKDDGEEYDRNHGGKRERCRRCKSVNIQRLHHIRCFDCGEEYISTSEEHTQDALLSVSQDATRILSVSDSIREASCHSDVDPISPAPTASVRQVATRITPPTNAQPQTDSLSLEEKLTDEEADFWIRWRALSGENKLNETAYKHIQELASKVTTTQDLQLLYDLAYQRLEELAKSQNKKAVPPRLGNLVNCLPELRQVQKRRDQERMDKEKAQEHIPGTGRLTNWTEMRQRGEEPPPLVYKRLETPSRSKPKGGAGGLDKITFGDLPLKKESGNIMSDHFTGASKGMFDTPEE